MANGIRDYLNMLHNHFSGIDYGQLLFEADEGKNTSLAEGKRMALYEIDRRLRELQELREDVQNLSLKKLQEKHIL